MSPHFAQISIPDLSANYDGPVKSQYCTLLSFLRRHESFKINQPETPAFARVTGNGLFTDSSIITTPRISGKIPQSNTILDNRNEVFQSTQKSPIAKARGVFAFAFLQKQKFYLCVARSRRCHPILPASSFF